MRSTFHEVDWDSPRVDGDIVYTICGMRPLLAQFKDVFWMPGNPPVNCPDCIEKMKTMTPNQILPPWLRV